MKYLINIGMVVSIFNLLIVAGSFLNTRSTYGAFLQNIIPYPTRVQNFSRRSLKRLSLLFFVGTEYVYILLHTYVGILNIFDILDYCH